MRASESGSAPGRAFSADGSGRILAGTNATAMGPSRVDITKEKRGGQRVILAATSSVSNDTF
jgi:hypothetical protein